MQKHQRTTTGKKKIQVVGVARCACHEEIVPFVPGRACGNNSQNLSETRYDATISI